MSIRPLRILTESFPASIIERSRSVSDLYVAARASAAAFCLQELVQLVGALLRIGELRLQVLARGLGVGELLLQLGPGLVHLLLVLQSQVGDGFLVRGRGHAGSADGGGEQQVDSGHLSTLGGSAPRQSRKSATQRKAQLAQPQRGGSAGFAHVRRLRALGTLLDVELDLLALGEAAEALGLDGRVVDEDVLAAAVRSDEAKALRIVEPLHDPCSHSIIPVSARVAARGS
jgi:hypothetical protein